jgi:apolipoprotein N-acyltransferase
MRVPTLNSTHYRLLGALLLGAASVLAYAPFGWFALVWLMLGGLYGLLGKCGTVREGARIGAAFGFGMFIAGVSWVYVSLSVFGGMPPPVAALATFLFCAVLTSFPTLVGALFVRFSPSRWLPRALFFSALWVFAEWLRGWVLTGFPWLAVGYSQSPPSPLAGFSPVLGVYGVSLICALLGALICEVFKRWLSVEPCRTSGRLSWLRWCPALPLLTVGLFLAVGDLLRDVRWVAPQGEPLSVALLQGNIPQDMKWRPEKFSDSLRTYYRLAADHPAQLTVLPETALPAFFDQVPREYFDELKKLAMRQQGDMLFGIALGDTESGGQRYGKSHLVPFGEFIPPGFAWFLAMAHIPMSDFTPGAAKQAPMQIAGQKVAVNICYEDAFGEEIIRALPEATLLVNLSNVAWFGDSLAPAQHLQIARMRALEAGRMMLRATNTGMTAIIGADGSVQAVLPPFTRDALVGKVHGYTGTTPFVRWGNWPVVLLAVLLIALFFRRKT